MLRAAFAIFDDELLMTAKFTSPYFVITAVLVSHIFMLSRRCTRGHAFRDAPLDDDKPSIPAPAGSVAARILFHLIQQAGHEAPTFSIFE